MLPVVFRVLSRSMPFSKSLLELGESHCVVESHIADLYIRIIYKGYCDKLKY
jgi:hypothetical protein